MSVLARRIKQIDQPRAMLKRVDTASTQFSVRDTGDRTLKVTGLPRNEQQVNTPGAIRHVNSPDRFNVAEVDEQQRVYHDAQSQQCTDEVSSGDETDSHYLTTKSILQQNTEYAESQSPPRRRISQQRI